MGNAQSDTEYEWEYSGTDYSEIAQRLGFRETSDPMGIIREAHETKSAGWMASGEGLELLSCVTNEILWDKGIDDVRFFVEQVRAFDYLDPNEKFAAMGLVNADHEVALYLSKLVPPDEIESVRVGGRTPLEIALCREHLAAAQYLVQHKGAKVTEYAMDLAKDAPMREFLAQHLDTQDPVE